MNNKNPATPIKELDLTNHIQALLEKANIKTVEELCEAPIDEVFKICNKEISLVVEILTKIEPFVLSQMLFGGN